MIRTRMVLGPQSVGRFSEKIMRIKVQGAMVIQPDSIALEEDLQKLFGSAAGMRFALVKWLGGGLDGLVRLFELVRRRGLSDERGAAYRTGHLRQQVSDAVCVAARGRRILGRGQCDLGID